MKNKSFLIFILGVFLFANNLLAQKQIDSLNYFYNIYIGANNNTDLLKSYQYFSKHKDLSIESNNIQSAIYDLKILASIEYRLGLYNESEGTSVTNLKLIEQLSESTEKNTHLVVVYNQIGIVNRKLMNYDSAIEMYNKSISFASNKHHIHTVLNNIGNIYKYQGQYKLAYKELSKSKNYFKSPMDTIRYARALSNLALVKSKLSFTGVFEDLMEAYNLRKLTGKKLEIYDGNIDMGEYYLDIEEKATAKTYFEKAYSIATELNSAQDRIFSLSRIIDCGDITKVYAYKSLRDSVEQVNYKIAYNFASQKYDYSEENKKRILSELGREKEHKTKIKYQFLVLLILLSGGPIYFLIRTKHKKDNLQQVYNTEKRISKKVHDEVANDMYQVMTKLQGNAHSSEELLDDLEDIYLKTRDVSKANSTIDFISPFEDVLNDLLLGYKSDATNIFTKGISTINWDAITNLKKTAIHRVLQELMTNMKKHSEATVVVMSFKQNNSKINIQYSDNGVGCTIKKGNGLQNTESRIETINGSITFESEPKGGFKATIKV